MPSGPGWLPRPRCRRLLALLACRDEMRWLPGYLRNVAPQVDGIVALDDGSSDGSAELLERSPHVLEVLRVPPERPAWDEVGNFRSLLEAAVRHGGEWALVLDADERLEVGFRSRAERVIARGRWLGLSAYSIRLRELWDSPSQYRCDGVWGSKGPARLFRLLPDHEVDTRELHATKAPMQAVRAGQVARAELEVYHLRMISPADRDARRRRYETLDPEARWQPREGYAYLTDERGLELRAIPHARRYED